MNLASKIAGPADDRTVAEQLRDLNVDVIGTVTLEKVRWVRPYANHPRAGVVTVGKTYIGLPAFVVDDLGCRALAGAGKYQGRPVLLLKPDDNGYKIHGRKESSKGFMNAPGMIEELIRAGVKHGCYEPVKVRGGWMCEKVSP